MTMDNGPTLARWRIRCGRNPQLLIGFANFAGGRSAFASGDQIDNLLGVVACGVLNETNTGSVRLLPAMIMTSIVGRYVYRHSISALAIR